MIEGWITQLRKALLEYCVLLVLRRGESCGYEIVQARFWARARRCAR
jgi:DNA-binding PadR family transcriptional regulator